MSRFENGARCAVLLIALMSTSAAAPLAGQSAAPSTPRGNFSFNVFADEESGMAPWTARLEVRDTTADGAKATRVSYRTRATASGYVYNNSATWRDAGAKLVSAEWLTARGAGGVCKVTAGNGEIRGSGTAGNATLATKHAPAPEFALASMVASVPLAEGDTARYTVFRCATGSEAPSMLLSWEFKGVVKSDSLARGEGAKPEPVWDVAGGADYPFRIWIAKSDRQVLRVIVPQGTIGFMTEVLAGPAK